MTASPSRRDLLAGSVGAVAGAAAAFGLSTLDDAGGSTDDQSPVPLSWADTEWPYPDYDAARSRHPPAASAPVGPLSVSWERREGTGIANRRAPPVVANGTVFAAVGGLRGAAVRAFDLETGTAVWRRDRVGASADTPTLAAPGDGLFYGVGDGETPLGLLGGRTGERVWGVSERPTAPLTVAAGALYCGDWTDGTLRAYDARTGRELWTTGVDEERLVVRAFHPDVGLGATAGGTLYALDPADGGVRWRRSVAPHVKSGPAFVGGRAYVTKWQDGMPLIALDGSSGAELWRYGLSPTTVSTDGGTFRRWYALAAATPDLVLVRELHADPTPGALHAVDAASGERRWRVTPPDGTDSFSAATVVAGRAYVRAVGDDRSELLVLDLADGSTRRSVALPPGTGAPVVADGRVLVTTGTGLVALD